MIKADLHVHTNHTDCSDSPLEVFEKAKANGVTTIAITDHDTLYGVNIFTKLAKQFEIDYIPGIEISAYDYTRNTPCHIVGLNVRSGYKPLEDMIIEITKERHFNSNEQVKKLIALGYDISFADFEHKKGIHGIYKQHIMDVLIEKGYADEMYGDFYKTMFKNNGPLEMNINYPSHIKATRILAESGAIPILAHPTLYGNLVSVEELVENGLKGIEISYPAATQKDVQLIKQLAKNYWLYLSGGSDYHGRYAKDSNGYIGSHFVRKLYKE